MTLYDFEKAIDFFQQSLSIAKETGSKDSEGIAYNHLGLAFSHLRNFSEAEDFLKSSVILLEEMKVLLPSKDEWKISFRDQYNFLKIYGVFKYDKATPTKRFQQLSWDERRLSLIL